MKRLAVVLLSLLVSGGAWAFGYLRHVDKEEAIRILTSAVPIKNQIYTCNQVTYNYAFIKQAENVCLDLQLNSAAESANMLCDTWAILKGSGAPGKMLKIKKEAESHVNTMVLEHGEQYVCEKISKNFSDFLIE